MSPDTYFRRQHYFATTELIGFNSSYFIFLKYAYSKSILLEQRMGIASNRYLSSHSHHFISKSFLISSSSNLFFMGFEGFPPMMVYGSTSLVTKDRLPMTAPSPIITPGIIIASLPIHTSLPIIVFLAPEYPSRAPLNVSTSVII